MDIKYAVKAQLPIVSASTRDTVNVMACIQEITGKTPENWPGSKESIKKGGLYVFKAPSSTSTAKAAADEIGKYYNRLFQLDATLILLNFPVTPGEAFGTGEIPTPKSLMMKYLTANLKSDDAAKRFIGVLGGCTIKEADELLRLTSARESKITPGAVIRTRKLAFQASPGLTLVDADQAYYEPHPDLAEWVATEKKFFFDDVDPRLVPRGLLLDGPPGTGKTAGAKYVAQQFEVPLYRVDISGTKNKYVGASEAGLFHNLQRLAYEAPCVALIDEVEKIFNTGTSDTSGVTQSMLSQLLWWLAEHQERVFVVMTTNQRKVIPPEMYRERRVDKVMVFPGLKEPSALKFAKGVAGTFNKVKIPDATLSKNIKSLYATSADEGGYVSQAALTEMVQRLVKEHL